MSPRSAPDDTLAISAVQAPAPTRDPGQSMCWTWPASAHLTEQVMHTVTECFMAWGLSTSVADLLGDLAAELASGIPDSPYVAVAVTLTDTQATLSARTTADSMTAEAQARGAWPTAQRARHRRPLCPTTWGLHGEVGNSDTYAVINFARRTRP